MTIHSMRPQGWPVESGPVETKPAYRARATPLALTETGACALLGRQRVQRFLPERFET
jgi:hypothetical protein